MHAKNNKMIVRIHHNEPPDGLNLNSHRPTKCSLEVKNQIHLCIPKRRDFNNVLLADNHHNNKNVTIHTSYAVAQLRAAAPTATNSGPGPTCVSAKSPSQAPSFRQRLGTASVTEEGGAVDRFDTDLLLLFAITPTVALKQPSCCPLVALSKPFWGASVAS